ncbi:MAG: hypothetical protein K1X67_01495 [Fimbriimonadaceae bacterium]|nr:hypothetical protein [Fimbriimonadaceae bacterium]
MPSSDYYPTRESELVQWHAQFAAALDSYSVALGIAPAVVVQAQVDAANVALALTAVEAANNYRSEVVAFKDQMLRGLINTPTPPPPTQPEEITLAPGSLGNIEARTRQLVAQIKANANFTQQMGEDMGIFPTDTPLADPTLTAQALTGSQVAIRVAKGGYSTTLLWRRRGEGDWEQLAILNTATYTDQTPPLVAGTPESRDYRVQGYANNGPTGPYSDVVTVITIP